MTESGRDPHREARRAGDDSSTEFVLGADGRPLKDRYGRPIRRRSSARPAHCSVSTSLYMRVASIFTFGDLPSTVLPTAIALGTFMISIVIGILKGFPSGEPIRFGGHRRDRAGRSAP